MHHVIVIIHELGDLLSSSTPIEVIRSPQAAHERKCELDWWLRHAQVKIDPSLGRFPVPLSPDQLAVLAKVDHFWSEPQTAGFAGYSAEIFEVPDPVI